MVISNIRQYDRGRDSFLEAQIAFKDKKAETLYFRVDRAFGKYLTSDATPFVAAVLLPCMQTGEAITVEGSMSERLYHNLPKIMDEAVGWKKGYKQIAVYVKVKKDTLPPRNIACFFSAGVDSFYTYLKNKEMNKDRINHFLFVHGFDIPINDQELYRSILNVIRKISKVEGISLTQVKTNIRHFQDPYADWSFTHGSAMAAVALALRRGFNAVHFNGGFPLSNLKPYGMTPRLDPLWSSDGMEILHSGAEVDRFEKIYYLLRYDLVLATLRVCWRNKCGRYNCCECEKCLRTMLPLYACGALRKAKTFLKPINTHILKGLRFEHGIDRHYRESLKRIEQKNKHDEIAAAIRVCLWHNKYPSMLTKIAYEMRNAMSAIDTKYFKSRVFYKFSRLGIV